MSRIVNNEKNIQMCIDVHGNLKKDVSKTSYVIYVELITPELSIKPNSIFSLSVYDARLLAYFFEETISEAFYRKDKTKKYADSNAIFEISVNASHYDDMYSIEFWLNLASITNGDKFGYDYGVRFATGERDYRIFATDILRSLTGLH